jgi:arylformamidase
VNDTRDGRAREPSRRASRRARLRIPMQPPLRQRPWRALAWLILAGAVTGGCGGGSGPPLPREIVDLSPVITPEVNIQRLGSRTLNFLGTDGRVKSTPVLPADPTFAWGMRTIELLSHTGAHVDAPARLLRGGEPPGRIDLNDLYGPARLIDLRWHNRHTPIEISDLELKPIEEGEIVILFIGFEPPPANEWPRYAALSAHAAEYLVAKKIRALATDLPAIVRFEDVESRLARGLPPEEVWAEYLPLFQAGIPIVAGLVNLNALLKQDKIVFVGFPLALAMGDGSPIRAAALLY